MDFVLFPTMKAAVQMIARDSDGATETMDNFCKDYGLGGIRGENEEEKKESVKRILNTFGNKLNIIPGVGHAKGAIHHAFGDHEGGNKALNSATRSAVIVGSAAAAGLATGGIAAIPAGVSAGAYYDMAATKITGQEQGFVAAMNNAYEDPSAGKIFDVVTSVVRDAKKC